MLYLWHPYSTTFDSKQFRVSRAYAGPLAGDEVLSIFQAI